MYIILQHNHYSFKPNSYLLGKREKLNLPNSTKDTELSSTRILLSIKKKKESYFLKGLRETEFNVRKMIIFR